MLFKTIVKKFVYVFILCFFTSSCGEQSAIEPLDTGGIALSVKWNMEQRRNKGQYRDSNKNRQGFRKKPETTCAVMDISTIKINVTNQTDTILSEFPCSTGSATVDEIPVGEGYTVYVTAENEKGEIKWSGTSEGVSINDSAPTPVGITFDKVEGVDEEAPKCPTFTINGGAQYTNTTTVTLAMGATDNKLITAYYLSSPVAGLANADTPPTSPFDPKWHLIPPPRTETFSGETKFTLSDGDGNKTISLCFYDSLNTSEPCRQSIILDTVSPVNTTQPNFIDNGAEKTSSKNIEVAISAIDENGVNAFFISESPETPGSESQGWLPIDTTTDYSASIVFLLTPGDGIKTIRTWLKDVAGNVSLAITDFIVLDTTPAEITEVFPLDEAANVPVDVVITATFKEQMNPDSINSAAFTLKTTTGGADIPGTVTYNDVTKTISFTPSTLLSNQTEYTATISSGIKDLPGNSTTGHTLSFTTIADDTVPPIVDSITPANGTTDVPMDVVITAVFNEPMEPSTINTATLVVKIGVVNIAGAVNYDQNTKTATFSPTTALGRDIPYTVTITTGAKDLAGNSVSAYTLSFQTAAAPPPNVITVCFRPGNATQCDTPSIQEGIDLAESGTTIRVAAGTYEENLTLKSGITLEGGWLSSFSGRNTSLYKSVIEGRMTSGFLLGASVISDVTVDGFTIQNGSKFGVNIVSGSRVVISNNNIYNNKGGIYFNQGDEILISKNQITKNVIGFGYTRIDGGGIYLGTVTSALIENNTIAFNSTSGNVNSNGGGIFSNGTVTISKNIIHANYSESMGGGIYAGRGAVTILENSIFNNSSNYGGGIHAQTPKAVTVSKNFILGNTSSFAGGILLAYPSGESVTFSNNIISNNVSTAASTDTAYFGGGGVVIWATNKSVYLLNNTITENSAEMGASGLRIVAGNVVIKNTILWGNTGKDFDIKDGTVSISYSNLCDTDGVTPYTGTYNRCEDPLFLDSSSNNFHLQQSSPMIDMATPVGAPTYDIDGDVRNPEAAIDIGADEVVP